MSDQYLILNGGNITILYWIIIGLLAGGAAELISPSPRAGISGSVILGMFGAVVGGYLGQVFFDAGTTGSNLISFALAAAGSLSVLFISRHLQQKILTAKEVNLSKKFSRFNEEDNYETF